MICRRQALLVGVDWLGISLVHAKTVIESPAGGGGGRVHPGRVGARREAQNNAELRESASMYENYTTQQ